MKSFATVSTLSFLLSKQKQQERKEAETKIIIYICKYNMGMALKGFGLAIGLMDIIGAVFFEIMIICMLCRQRSKNLQQKNVASESLELFVATTYASVISNHQSVAALYGKGVGPKMLLIYLILLNVWILASTLLVVGIIWVCSFWSFFSSDWY